MTNINFKEFNENMNKMGQSAHNAVKSFYAMNTNTVEQFLTNKSPWQHWVWKLSLVK